MLVGITGATGFIGRRLAEYHLKSGNEVRYLTRTDTNPIVGARAFIGDVNSTTDQLTPFLTNVYTFYHCAGEIKVEASMRATHVQGTANLLQVIEGIRKQRKIDFHWIQLSSCGAYGKAVSQISLARFIDENTKDNPTGEYECTKTEVDNLIIAFAKKHDWFKYTIIRPTIVFGVGSRSSLILRIASVINKKLFFYVGNKNAVANFVDVDDVVKAMFLSANQPKAYNQVFIVSNDCNFSEVVDTIAETLHVSKPKWVINESFLRKFIDVVGKWVKLPINGAQIDVMVRRTYYSNEKLRKVLGWSSSGSIPKQLKQYINSVFVTKNG